MSLAGLAFGNKIDAPVYISQESGVVGLNFHQSKEVLISDSVNGSVYGVSIFIIILLFIRIERIFKPNLLNLSKK